MGIEATALNHGRERLVADLRGAGCVFAEDETAQLLDVLRRRGFSLDAPPGQAVVRDYVNRRGSGEPAEYILGWGTLAGIRVEVGPGVFIPRPWSTDLARRAAEVLSARDGGVAVDLGTGSGAIALAVAALAPHSRIWATETDPDAARWAELNCTGQDAVTVCLGDLYDPLPRWLQGQVDVIFGSLPYVPTSELAVLPRDHLTNEPVQAFDGGDRGLAVVTRALIGAHRWLRPGGRMLMEIGAGQGPGAATIAAEAGLQGAVIHRDEGGGELFLEATA
jgi:release factor glutamine methyltransferase